MSGERFKNIYRAVYKSFEEVLQIKNFPRIIVGVIVKKSPRNHENENKQNFSRFKTYLHTCIVRVLAQHSRNTVQA